MRKRIAIIGGCNVDIFATSAQPLVSHDSNPGSVTFGFGGVGRNIAENLARLGQEVMLISALGTDPFSAKMYEYTAEAGINVEHCAVIADGQAPFYVSINDSSGDMAVAVNDMKICGHITPAFLAQKMDMINRCDAVVVDTNIPQESVVYLAEHCKPPFFAEAVSTRKVLKLAPVLPHLAAIKTNLQEAEALLETSLRADYAALVQAAERFHAMGIQSIIITLGQSGAFLSHNGKQDMQNAFPVRTTNTNGCGDAFAAAAFLGILLQEPPEIILHNALAASAITAQSEQAVNPALSRASIRAFLNELR